MTLGVKCSRLTGADLSLAKIQSAFGRNSPFAVLYFISVQWLMKMSDKVLSICGLFIC